MSNKILITGCAGFIGFSLCNYLLKKNKTYQIIGIDDLNNYYSVKYKKKRLNLLKKNKNFIFKKIDISSYEKLKKIFNNYRFDFVVNLAAQAGVRYSISNPKAYINSNIIGFFNIIDLCREKKINKIFYASSSSVYGDSKKFPLNEKHYLNPKNVYGLSKKFNEEIAETYSRLFHTKRIDYWWVEPFLTAFGFLCFVVYTTWRAFSGVDFVFENYLSPFYSPLLFHLPNDVTGHSWLDYGQI